MDTVAMEADVLEAFTRSAERVFTTMLRLEARAQEAYASSGGAARAETGATLALAGGAVGVVAMAMSRQTASRLALLFAGEAARGDESVVADALGEMLNMITGGAKAMLGERGISISCPRAGLEGLRERGPEATRIVAPFETDCGSFELHLAVEMMAQSEER